MATPNPAGYSGTPLAKKLGIKEGSSVVALGAPDGYRDLLAPLPDGVAFGSQVSGGTDVVHLFVTQSEELAGQLAILRRTIRPDAQVWVSWPKKASKIPTDITEETIR